MCAVGEAGPLLAAPVCRRLPAPPGVRCVGLRLDEVARGVPDDGPPTPAFAALLSDEELCRFAQLRLRKRRIEWLAGRIAAKQALRHMPVALRHPRQATVRQAADGRPAFEGYALSISHSRREAFAAVSARAVGVDTETFDAMRAESLSALIRPDEAHALARDLGCDLQAARTVAWCLKEALFKAAGGGAFVPFACALQLDGWPAGDISPAWHWHGESARHLPALDAWRVGFGLERDAAWAIVAALIRGP